MLKLSRVLSSMFRTPKPSKAFPAASINVYTALTFKGPSFDCGEFSRLLYPVEEELQAHMEDKLKVFLANQLSDPATDVILFSSPRGIFQFPWLSDAIVNVLNEIKANKGRLPKTLVFEAVSSRFNQDNINDLTKSLKDFHQLKVEIKPPQQASDKIKPPSKTSGHRYA